LYLNSRYAYGMPDLAVAVLTALRVRVTRVMPMQVHAALETLTDAQIWWRPNEKSNSIGNLVLHLTGSLNHYLNRNIGGMTFDRDRDAEFAAREPLPKAALLSLFDQMMVNAETTFERISPDSLTAPSTDPDRYSCLIEDLINVTTHLSNHVGQIVWIAKMQQEGSLDEAWMRAHKQAGAWKR
jgi:uncharacterized damage-inducible protein DinB